MSRAADARHASLPLLVLAAAAAFWFADLALLGSGFPDPLDDSWEYGLVARSILDGSGFQTPVVHPPLWSLRDAVGTVPVLVHGPLIPLLMLPLVTLLGAAAVDHVAWIAALFAALTAAGTARLALRLGPPTVAIGAAMLVTASPLMLRAVHHDVALPVGAWLLVTAVEAAWRSRPRAVVAGAAMGLGALVRPEFLLISPIVLALLGRSAWRGALATAAIVAPWGWHGAVHAGTPFFNLSSYLLIGYWRERPGISVMRDFALAPEAWPHALREAWPSLPGKWAEFLPSACKRVLMTPSGATGLLAPAGLAAALARPQLRALAAVAAALALLPLVIMTVTLYDERYLTPVLPLFALGSALGVHAIANRLPGWLQRPRFRVLVVVALLLPSAGPALHDGWREGAAARERLQRERASLAARSPRATALQLVFTDTPDFVAWTLGVPAVWVTRPEYDALPAWQGDGISPYAFTDRPRRTPADVTWFHAAEGRGEPEAAR